MQKHKKGKNQQKKAAMVQQTIREALIYGANKVKADAYVGDGSLIPLEALTFCCNDDVYQVSPCASSESLSRKDKLDIFNLVETNLKVYMFIFVLSARLAASRNVLELIRAPSLFLFLNFVYRVCIYTVAIVRSE